MPTLSPTVIASLRSRCRGEVLVAGDEGYDGARSIWNGAIDKKPGVIVRCRDAADVATALQHARQAGIEVSVRGGGHNVAGFALTDGGLTIDLSAMRDVAVDPANRRATCGGGATWEDLDAACQQHGLAVPGGFVSHTGVAGLTLGGGLGWLTRRAGLSCDNLIAAEVVTADGRVVRAADTENADLFWAIRGGGGNFGVVTSFTFRLHEVGPMVNLALLFWGVDRGRDVLRFARDFIPALPPEATAFIGGLSAPPEPFVPERYHFQTGYALLVVGFGDAESHGRLAARVREALPPLFEMVTPIPYVALQQIFNASSPWGLLAYVKAVHLDEFTDDAIEVITTHFPKKQSPMSIMPVFALGGAYAAVAEDAVAFGGSRETRYVVSISAGAMDADTLAAEREWVRSFWSALVPHASGVGSYVNFMSEHEENRVRAAYGPAKYDRLAAIKAKWDPDNVFHLNANVKPS